MRCPAMGIAAVMITAARIVIGVVVIAAPVGVISVIGVGIITRIRTVVPPVPVIAVAVITAPITTAVISAAGTSGQKNRETKQEKT